MSDSTAIATIDSVRFAHGVFRDLLGNVGENQWDDPTPNDEWNVRQMVNHVIQVNRWIERSVTGAEVEFPQDDFVGDQDPVEVFDASYRGMLMAFDLAVDDDRLKEWYFESTTDLMTHSWDLAKATGQNTNIAPELNQSLLDECRKRFADYDRSTEGFYKDEVPVPDTLPAADRFAAFLGKQP